MENTFELPKEQFLCLIYMLCTSKTLFSFSLHLYLLAKNTQLGEVLAWSQQVWSIKIRWRDPFKHVSAIFSRTSFMYRTEFCHARGQNHAGDDRTTISSCAGTGTKPCPRYFRHNEVRLISFGLSASSLTNSFSFCTGPSMVCGCEYFHDELLSNGLSYSLLIPWKNVHRAL
jgi:hypothetical protein